jgi:hypothetical protein
METVSRLDVHVGSNSVNDERTYRVSVSRGERLKALRK